MSTVRRIAACTAAAAALLAGCTSNSDQAGPSPSGSAPGSATGAAPTTQTASPSPGGSGGGETEGAQPQACSLVTAEDAKAALGTEVGAGRSQQIGVYTGCTFTAADKSGSTVTVQVLRSGATAAAFDEIISGQGTGAVHVVPGVGDKAVQVSSILLFHKGSTVVTVLVLVKGKDPSASQSAEVTLAKQVAGRI